MFYACIWCMERRRAVCHRLSHRSWPRLVRNCLLRRRAIYVVPTQDGVENMGIRLSVTNNSGSFVDVERSNDDVVVSIMGAPTLQI
jgi:hypothetical protein